jgi:hypothetical protein
LAGRADRSTEVSPQDEEAVFPFGFPGNSFGEHWGICLAADTNRGSHPEIVYFRLAGNRITD